MRAAVVSESGLELREVAQPTPAQEQVVVRVRAASLNRADLTVVAGQQHGRVGGPGTIPGLEWAGEVAEVGTGVTDLKPGDRVMCSGGGGYAEFAVTDMGRAAPLPEGMDFTTAATLPVALQTMHDALITNGRLVAGEAVMIQGASSGVGLMGLQIAKLKGARLVIGSSTNAARRARLGDYGADLTVDTSQPDWADRVLAATDGDGVNVIVDQVSASVANENLRACAILGRIVNVGRLGGAIGPFDFDLHALRRISYIGVTFRTRSVAEVRAITARVRDELGPAVADGRLRLPIDSTFALDRVGEAVARMRANAHFGKIVLTM